MFEKLVIVSTIGEAEEMLNSVVYRILKMHFSSVPTVTISSELVPSFELSNMMPI